MTSSSFSLGNLLEGPFWGLGVSGVQSDNVLVQEQDGLGENGDRRRLESSHCPAPAERRASGWMSASGVLPGSQLGPLGLSEQKAEPQIPRSHYPL